MITIIVPAYNESEGVCTTTSPPSTIVVGLVSGSPPHVMACRQWAHALVLAGRRVLVAEIADYEVRRELIRNNSNIALSKMEEFFLAPRFARRRRTATRRPTGRW